jgi:uncharacterized protein YfiM (DUF2279 family)
MRILAKSLAALLLTAAVVLPLGVIGLLALAWYCTDEAPSVVRLANPTPGDVARALHLAARNDPRQAKPGLLRNITLTQEELDLVVPQLANRLAKGHGLVVLADGHAQLQLSLPLPSNPFGPWLNVQTQLVQTDGLPALRGLRLGRLQVPQPVADWVLARGLAWLQQTPTFGPAGDIVQQVAITPQALQVVYAWHDGLPELLRSALLPTEQVQRLRHYQDRLAQLTQTVRPGGLALHELLQPLLVLAGERSGAQADADARAQEYRAALLVLAFYVNGKGLGAIAPAAAEGPAPRIQRVHLSGRGDLAQHYSISAALAAWADTPLADAVGLYKELEDAKAGGSGFSFVDLLADRAGARLGALAVGPAAGQARLQQRVARGLAELDLLPSTRDLPEFLPQAVFQRRYGEAGSPAYKRMQSDIDRRIGALALYR